MLDLNLDKPNLDLLFKDIVPGHWMLKTNILGLLQMRFINFADLNDNNENDKEIEVNSILSKIANLAVSFYCMSTETRFIDDAKK